MRIPLKSRRRHGSAVIEAAIILPVVFFLLLGTTVGCSLVFSYQEVATLAREGARYACVHGTRHSADEAEPPATASDIYNNAILPRMMTLDPSQVTYSVSWNTSNKPGHYVSVQVNYNWSNVIFGDVALSSTSTVRMMW
jgi:Flp pilus assembly protein TadG